MTEAQSGEGKGVDDEYPVYEPEDYQCRNYPLNGRVKVWDPGLERTIDSTTSSVPNDCIILEVETMFVEREYIIPVIDVRTSLDDEKITASHVCLGESHPGIHVIFPVSEDKYIEYRRSFTEEREEYRKRDGPAPSPTDSNKKVIWVSNPENQHALTDTTSR